MRPVKPSRRERRQSRSRPSVSRKSTIQRVDRRDLGGGGREQTLRAGDRIRERPGAVGLLVVGSPDRGGEVFRAPGQADEPRMRGGIGAEGKHRFRGFRRHDREFDRALRHSGLGFERVQVVRDAFDVRRAVRLRDQQSVETGFDDGAEIVERQAGVERVDADEERPVARRLLLEQSRRRYRAPRPSATARRNLRDRGSAHRRRPRAPWRTSARNLPGTNSSERSLISASSASARRGGRSRRSRFAD